jgi:signal transduction histidine kinase
VHEPDGNALIRTDPEKVRHVLVELLSNAIKFTREGGVELDASSSDRTATFRIADTGLGVPVELREKIFEPFFQAEEALTREVGGTGIGLAVARGLARRLGGDVTVSSRPNGGSMFKLTIPQMPAEKNPVARVDNRKHAANR